jgi:hypothetical protein
MKSEALQEMIKKIFNDGDVRSQFLTNPDSVIRQYSLTETETNAVLNMHSKLGLVTADSAQMEEVLGPMNRWA